jgi:hypothetical protein
MDYAHTGLGGCPQSVCDHLRGFPPVNEPFTPGNKPFPPGNEVFPPVNKVFLPKNAVFLTKNKAFLTKNAAFLSKAHEGEKGTFFIPLRAFRVFVVPIS